MLGASLKLKPVPSPSAGRRLRAVVAHLDAASTASAAAVSTTPCAAAATTSSSSLPAGHVIRAAHLGDYARGLPQLLAAASGSPAPTAAVDERRFRTRLQLLAEDEHAHAFVVVAENGGGGGGGRCVAYAALVVEPKFIHECGFVAHIEDVVVAPDTAGGAVLAEALVEHAGRVARQAGCYKMIANVSRAEGAAPAAQRDLFLRRCAFADKGAQMVIRREACAARMAGAPAEAPGAGAASARGGEAAARVDACLGTFNANRAAAGGLRVRRLAPGDDGRRFLEVLGQLTTVGTVSADAFEGRRRLLAAGRRAHVLAIVDEAPDSPTRGQVVAAGTLFVEYKLGGSAAPPASPADGAEQRQRGPRQTGHIEDIVVNSAVRGRGLGKLVVHALRDLCFDALACDTLILDCSLKNVPFYEKCGFVYEGIALARYFDEL